MVALAAAVAKFFASIILVVFLISVYLFRTALLPLPFRETAPFLFSRERLAGLRVWFFFFREDFFIRFPWAMLF